VLGVNLRQLDRPFQYPSTGIADNQLRVWRHIGMFAAPLDTAQPSAAGRLSALDDRSATLKDRARSYLDVNCAQCHFPGGQARVSFDARFSTPLLEQGVLNSRLQDPLNSHDSRIIAPGNVSRSMLRQRMSSVTDTRMPPLGSSVVHADALAVFDAWIQSLEPLQLSPSLPEGHWRF